MSVNLNAGVSIRTIFADSGLDEATLSKIEELSSEGFTEDELTELRNGGVDTNIILENSTSAESATTSSKTTDDVRSKITELQERYCEGIESYSGTHPYSTDNPQLTRFSSALEDGIVADLRAEGFSKSQIIDIIGQTFDKIGISNADNGGYNLPNGTDSTAKEIYNKFQSQLYNVTTGSTSNSKEIQSRVATLNTNLRNNSFKLQELECIVLQLENEIEQKMDEGIDQIEQIEDEQRIAAKATVARCLSEYTSAEGEMTYEEFLANVDQGMKNNERTADGKLRFAVLSLIQAERRMGSLNDYLGEMRSLNQANVNLKSDFDKAIEDLNKVEVPDANSDPSACDPDANRCDPFFIDCRDTDGQAVRLTIMFDKDNNGELSNENEFAGAENGLAELQDINIDEDTQYLDAQELKDGGAKIVVTKADGTQEIMDPVDAIGEGGRFGQVKFDMDSYTLVNEELDNGDKLVGTMDYTVDGETVENGFFQTLDKIENLDAVYTFSDEAEGKGRFAVDEDQAIDYEDREASIARHEATYNDLRANLNNAWVSVAGTDVEFQDTIHSLRSNAQAKAADIQERFEELAEAKEAAAAEEAQEAEEAEDAEEADETETTGAADEAETAEGAEETEGAEGTEGGEETTVLDTGESGIPTETEGEADSSGETVDTSSIPRTGEIDIPEEEIEEELE